MLTLSRLTRHRRSDSFAVAVWPCRLLRAAPASPGIPASEQKINFNRDIRPILSDRCFACHGPDANKRQSGLRLDMEKEAVRPAAQAHGQAGVRPGNVAESLRVPADHQHRPGRGHAAVTVPHLKLNQREKDLVKQWIEEGASWSEHWSFVTPKRPEPPVVTEPGVAAERRRPVRPRRGSKRTG